jgi:adenosylcobinamide-GDP ribazoletransferase
MPRPAARRKDDHAVPQARLARRRSAPITIGQGQLEFLGMTASAAAMHPPSPLSLWWNDFTLAAGVLTRLPIGRVRRAEAGEMARATRVLPLVGVLVALGGALAYWLAQGLGLPPLVCALTALAATVWITGAFHEDGLADTADGFGGGAGRARKLEIMRDSRIGTYGVLAIVFSVALRAAALAEIGATGAAALALIGAHALSRAVLPPIMAALPLARDDGLAAHAGRPETRHAGTAAVMGAVIALLTLGLGAGLIAVLVAGAAAATVAFLARAHIGGYTGDVLGAAEQAAQTTVLLAVAALA